MTNGRSIFFVKQVEAEINQIFPDLIDMSDYSGKKANHKKDAFNSRALAAYSLHVLAEVSPKIAAEAVVDGYDDNGIDAFLFHKKQNTLWLVQAKWIQDGQSSPKKADLGSFKDGVFDLLDFNSKLRRFNDKFQLRSSEINSAITSAGLKIKIVVAYTGPDLARHATDVMTDCVNELNANDIDGGIASVELFNLSRAYNAVADSHKQEDIDVKISLSNWGRVEEPYQAIYGQINATEVAKWWIQHKNKLFSKNIRDFLGESDVNFEIERTLEHEPELFWYFNNGVTVLCKDILKANVKKDRKEGEFIAKGISIVNGAQTIGSIGALYQEYSQDDREKLESAEIFIKFISLDKCSVESGLTSEDFGLKVTRATNTQNRVEIRDFVALDSQQERLYREFRSNGRNYHYKRTAEVFDRDEKNYELEEATVALACASDDPKLFIFAKQDLSKLWSDTSQYPYTAIFRSSVHATQLWRQIDVKREVERIIKCKQEESKNQKELDLLKYGNLFVLHLVFKQVKSGFFSAEISESDFDCFKKFDLSNLVESVIRSTVDYLDRNGKSNRLWMLFNSASRCVDMRNSILKK